MIETSGDFSDGGMQTRLTRKHTSGRPGLNRGVQADRQRRQNNYGDRSDAEQKQTDNFHGPEKDTVVVRKLRIMMEKTADNTDRAMLSA